MSVEKELQSFTNPNSPAQLGEQAGWDGEPASANPFTAKAARETWERRRQRGYRARIRYFQIQATKW